MKTNRKIFFGLSLLVALGVFTLFGQQALAAPVNEGSFQNTLYRITALENGKPKTISVNIAGRQFTFTDKNTGDNTINLKLTTNGFFICEQGDSSTTGITLTGAKSPIPSGGESYPGHITANYKDDTNEKCEGNADKFLNKLPIQAVFGVPGTGGTGGSTEDDPADACYIDSTGFSLSWFMCPLMQAGDDLANKLLEIFESQLSFTVSQDLGNQDSQSRVKLAWSLIKNIASAGLVIIMLIMIFSQAIGVGIFDAYTIKKMLPRLVIAAIAIQLSWPIFAFIVDLVNNIGNGLASFLFLPFGGSDNLKLGALLENAGMGTAEAIAINWIGLIAALALGIAALPTALFLVFAAIVALFTALVVLVLRKIIIIMCLILAPLALLAWILPGTQRYWKLWADNFIKVLAMFPIIIALIASGRIFAYIVGTQDQPAAAGGQLLSIVLVMVGFFGPLFLLPKAFKWGGTAMSLTGSAVTGMSKRYSGRDSALGKGIQGYGERWQGKKAKAYNPHAGFAERSLRRIQSGHMLPTERSRRLTIASGNRWAGERNEEADAYVGRVQEKALSGYNLYEMDDDGKFLKYSRRQNAAGQYLDASGNIVDKKDAAYLDAAGNHLDAAGSPISKSKAHRTIVSRDNADFETVTGVQAGKQALIDIAGNSGKSVTDQRAAQAAQKLLIDTHSEIEFQTAQIQGGANQGRRANEVESWKGNITSSPQHYSTISGSRPDLAPDLLESAEAATSKRLGRVVTYPTASAADRREIDVDKALIAIERLTPDQVQRAHYGLYDDIGKVGNQPAIDRRSGNPILDAAGNPVNVSQLLAQRLTEIKNAPGPVGSGAVGSLYGGKKDHVDAALRAAGYTLETLP